MVLGGLFVVFLIAVAVFIGYSAREGRGLDESSKEYVEANLPPILSIWSKDALTTRASPQLLAIVEKNPGQMERVFQKLATLGVLRSLGGIHGEAKIGYTAREGKVVTAAYDATAKF